MHQWLPINPLRVSKFARKWELKHLIQSAVRSILCIRHNNGNISLSSSSLVPPGSIVLIFCHRRIDSIPGISSTPLDVSSRLNRVIEISIREDGSVCCIPRSAQSTLSFDTERAVCGFNKRVMDVCTICVREGSVGAFPCCYATATTTEGEQRRLNPQGAEPIQEVCLAGDSAVVHIRIS
jgi:hypothetical protein